MKKVLTLSLLIMSIMITGCAKEEDTFEHYDLKDKDLNTYVYHSDERGKEIYVLADLTPSTYESCLTGLFYKVAEDDYILLETLEFNQKESYKKDYVYKFYNDKLFGVGNGVSPMVFEIKLNGKKSKIKEIEYEANGKINPFLITKIKEINNNEIIYSGYATIDENNIYALINCSTSKYECTITEND